MGGINTEYIFKDPLSFHRFYSLTGTDKPPYIHYTFSLDYTEYYLNI